MTAPAWHTRSELIAWVKRHGGGRFSLAASGIRPFPLEELGASLEQIEINGPSAYGYPPLQRALAQKCGVPEDRLVAAVGCTMANHVAFAAILQPGDHVVIEKPCYEPLPALARHLGTDVAFFDRRPQEGWEIDPERVLAACTPATRLIVITNLHNPSGALTSEATLRRLGEIARQVGARVLVDEVYLDMVEIEGGSPPVSASRLGDEFVVTSSLTKAYGLNGLRCGWVLAEPDLASRMWGVFDLFLSIPAHPAERLSVLALSRLETVARRSRAILQANRAALRSFVASRQDLEIDPPSFGAVAFPRWCGGDAERVCTIAREAHETAVVPGRLFGSPGHFRIGIGEDPPAVAEGLRRLGLALDSAGRDSVPPR
ncbi:MAG TPA: pyridoxal phosphate-dependent aminotransferase [Thermoanaerobaculia bacterium]